MSGCPRAHGCWLLLVPRHWNLKLRFCSVYAHVCEVRGPRGLLPPFHLICSRHVRVSLTSPSGVTDCGSQSSGAGSVGASTWAPGASWLRGLWADEYCGAQGAALAPGLTAKSAVRTQGPLVGVPTAASKVLKLSLTTKCQQPSYEFLLETLSQEERAGEDKVQG